LSGWLSYQVQEPEDPVFACARDVHVVESD